MGEESLSNVRTVKAFAREEEEDERYGNEIDRYYQLAKQMGVSLAIFQGSIRRTRIIDSSSLNFSYSFVDWLSLLIFFSLLLLLSLQGLYSVAMNSVIMVVLLYG